MQKTISSIRNDYLPSVSIVIPTYNSDQTLAQCLESIVNQDYPREKVEIIIVDGGSKDNTLETARKYKVNKILNNALKIEEFGRALGIEASNNELIAFIDQDNVLVSSKWLEKMVKPFEDKGIIGSEPLFYSYRLGDSSVVRYCSLIGADDPFYVYLGYYDRFCYFRNKWTEMPIEEKNEAGYLRVKLTNSEKIPTMGANGFIVRKRALKKIRYRPFIHTDIIFQLVKLGDSSFAKVKTGLVHLHARGITEFLKKKIRRARRYAPSERKYNIISLRNQKVPLFILQTLLLVTGFDAVKGYRRKPDTAWLLHPIICLFTLPIYTIGALSNVSKR